MPKVMLVEDDNNLREIYEARLAAEGYQIVSAHDGEEALALAVKERPDLIISDVMMPKISGFDMLDILRTTPETKNTRVIMMTALSQAEDRDRADKLGADRYLVKSQVTLEDVIKVAHEILNDTSAPGTAGAAPAPAPAAIPVTEAAAPVEAPTVVEAPPVANEPSAAPAPAAKADDVLVEPPASIADPTATPAAPAQPATPTTTVTDVSDSPAPAATTPQTPPETTTPSADTPQAVSAPAPEPAASAPVSGSTATPPPSAEPIKDDLTQTKTEETDVVEKQIQDFVANNPSLSTSADAKPAEPAATPAPAAKSIPVIEVPTPEPEAKPEPTTAPPAPTAPAVDEPKTDDIPPKPAEEHNDAPSHKKLVLTPTENALAPPVDLDALLAKENENEAAEAPQANAVISPTTSPTTTTEAGTTSSADPSDPNQIAL